MQTGFKSTSDMTSALNVSGAPFQMRVADLIRKAGWKVIEEYPVGLIPLKPIKWDPSYIERGKSKGIDYQEMWGDVRDSLTPPPFHKMESSAIDVFAQKNFVGATLNSLVEVKKRDPKFKTWVF